MDKLQNLADFHFEPAKSGKILKKWIQDAGVSYAYVSKETGITPDTLNNCMRGLVQDLRIERVFKIGLVTGHTVDEYVFEMMKDEEIDFVDQIAEVYTAEKSAPVIETKPAPASAPAHKETHSAAFEEISQRLHAEQNEILDRFKNVYTAYVEQLKDQIRQLKESREIMKHQYEKQLDTMERQHREHDAEIEKAHRANIDRADAENVRLRKSNRWKTIALTCETALIVGVCMFDLANHNIGWFRGLINSPASKISLKG